MAETATKPAPKTTPDNPLLGPLTGIASALDDVQADLEELLKDAFPGNAGYTDINHALASVIEASGCIDNQITAIKPVEA